MLRCAITIPKFIDVPSSVLPLDLELKFTVDIEFHAFSHIVKRLKILRLFATL